MSMITENTIVIKACDEASLMEDYKKYCRDYRMGDSLCKVFANDDIAVFVFDANGDAPWEIEQTKADYLALETNYFDGEEPWTRIKGKEENEMTIDKWLCEILSGDDYAKVSGLISYSC